MSSSGWKATVNAQPIAKSRLGVTGSITTSSGGYKVVLERRGTDFNPKIVTLELTATPPPSGSSGTAAITPHRPSVTVPDVVRDLEKVIINCGGSKLTEITDITVLD